MWLGDEREVGEVEVEGNGEGEEGLESRERR